MMVYVRTAISWIWSQKWKGLIIVLLIPLFLLILFPMKDLSDLVTGRVAAMTGNQIYVQFDEMGIKLFPDFGLQLEKFSVETPMFPPLNVQKLVASPSVVSLLTQKPAGNLVAEGIFRGNASVAIRPGRKAENGAPLHAVTLKGDQLQLQDLKQFLALPVNIKGPLSLNADGNLDLTFSNQPDISFDAQTGKLELASSVINLPLGPVVLPDIALSRLSMKGRLSAGQLLIEDVTIGKEGDELVGKVSGNFNLELKNMNGMILPMQGSYNYKVDLWAHQAFEDRARFFLSIIDAHKVAEGPGHRYRFTLSGDARTGQFKVDALR